MSEKKNEGTIECDKSTITCHVGIVQFENGIIKCKKKYEYNWMWQKCKSIIKCDVNTVQCDDETIKCENK